MGNQLGINLKKSIIKSNFYFNCQLMIIEGYNLMIKDRDDIKKSLESFKTKFPFRYLSSKLPLKIISYLIMPNYSEWEEEKINAVLLKKMKTLHLTKLNQITVQREHYLDDEDILKGDKPAKSADRIDFIFSTWFMQDEITYFGEAKNVSCNDWTKKSGAKVNANYYLNRYIATGIQAVADGKYNKILSFIIGYVVNGTPTDVVDKLNIKLKKDKLSSKYGLIQNQHTIHQHPNCYESQNPSASVNKTIKHIFLKFN